MKVRLNTALNDIRGTLAGERQTYRTYRGNQFIQNKPTFTLPWAEGTLATRKTFGAADQWCKQVVKPDPELTLLYREKGRARLLNYRQMAIRDFLNPPTVHSLSVGAYRAKDGGELVILASDDFEVTRVSVTLRDANGAVMTEHEASQKGGPGSSWDFVAPAAIGERFAATVDIIAYDRPGNTTMRSFPLPPPEGVASAAPNLAPMI